MDDVDFTKGDGVRKRDVIDKKMTNGRRGNSAAKRGVERLAGGVTRGIYVH